MAVATGEALYPALFEPSLQQSKTHVSLAELSFPFSTPILSLSSLCYLALFPTWIEKKTKATRLERLWQ